MAASKAPAVKAALVTLFDAATAATVTWAAPTDEEDYVAEMVWLGDVDQEENFRLLGRQSIDEEFTIDVWIQAIKEGDNPQATEERAWAIREECVTALRSDLTLGGVVNQWIGPFPTRMETRPAGQKQWLAKAQLTLRCRARI